MFTNPFLPVLLGFQAARIGLEAQAVIALRLAGMAGLWNTPKGENSRMVQEKAEAAIEAGQAVTLAALAGKGPAQVLQAGMDEIGKHTAGNMKRLARRGPKRVL